MHLISPLAAGVAGAENGSVAVYRRGTTTRATVYEDFEGTSSLTPTANMSLDSDGRIVRYVNELVECFVYDSGGGLVCMFTAGSQASAVEVRSQSFTGTSYETGALAAGNSTTLAAVLDLWKTNSGSIDFKVLIGGVATTLQAAFGAIGGLVYNVTSSAYGAAGNGTTDDTTAIAAAITACDAAGGGIVWFPEGAYRITSALTLSDKVSLVGAGAGCTTITIDHASNNCITTAGSTTVTQAIVGLALKQAQASTGNVLSIAAGSVLAISQCSFGDVTYSNVPVVTVAASASTYVKFADCHFTWSTAAAATGVSCNATRRLVFDRCRFVAPATAGAALGMISGTGVTCTNCYFDASATTSGTLYGYTPVLATVDALFRGCAFPNAGGATFTAYQLGAYAAAGVFSEEGSIFGSTVTAYNYTVSVANIGAQIALHSRTFRALSTTNSAATYTAPVKQYGIIRVVNTTAGNTAIAIDGMPPPGSRGQITIENDDGSNRTFSPASVASGTPGFHTSTGKVINTTNGNAMDYWATQYQIAGDSDYLVLINTWVA